MEEVERNLRERLATVGRKLFEEDMTYGTEGNISSRIPDTNNCLIKPSRVSFENLEPEHFVAVDIETGKAVSGTRRPSIETPFHTVLYRLRKDVGGVVHVHPHYTTIFATAEVELIPMGIIALRVPTLLKGVGIAKFAMPGSSELAENLVEGIAGRDAVLMPHHGVTTVGKTIERAAQLAEAVEELAKFQYELMQIGTPEPLPLDPKLMARLSNL